MPSPISALRAELVGRHQTELDTPSLCIDLDLMEANLRSMAEFLKAREKAWRPHCKCHKNPAIAHQQLAAGAIGITSAKTTEAEVFVEAGVEDVLIANMVAGEAKLRRLAGMCRRGNPIVACDHFAQAEALAAVCHAEGVTCRVIIEVDLGLNRVGIRPGPDARTLAQGIARLKGVELVGVMGYEGHLLIEPDQDKKRSQIMTGMSLLAELRDAMRSDGIRCEIVSAGGTGSYQITADHPAVTELQAGGGIFGDPFYRDRCHVKGLEPAIRVIATVVSRPSLDRAVLDIGRKSVHPDIHPPSVECTIEGRRLPDTRVESLSAEHTVLDLGPESQSLVIGDRVLVIPGYTDHTTVLHDTFLGLRQGIVKEVWPIAARGKLQ